MTTATTLSMEQYLQTSYRPDRDYVDGELEDRNLGKFDHARIQALLAIWFGSNETFGGTVALTEQRVRVSSNRVRIPDVTLVPIGPTPDVLTEPPTLVVEILSPEDSYTSMQQRCEDYRGMGVGNIWIIDPHSRTGRMWDGAGWSPRRRLETAGAEIFVDLDTLFRQLDASRTQVRP